MSRLMQPVFYLLVQIIYSIPIGIHMLKLAMTIVLSTFES